MRDRSYAQNIYIKLMMTIHKNSLLCDTLHILHLPKKGKTILIEAANF